MKRRLRAAKLNGQAANNNPLVSNENHMEKIAFRRAHESDTDFPWQSFDTDFPWLFDEAEYCRLSSDGKVYGASVYVS